MRIHLHSADDMTLFSSNDSQVASEKSDKVKFKADQTNYSIYSSQP